MYEFYSIFKLFDSKSMYKVVIQSNGVSICHSWFLWLIELALNLEETKNVQYEISNVSGLMMTLFFSAQFIIMKYYSP